MQRMPGATLMSRFRVYDTAAPDGQRSGTPHVHLLCGEMYVILGGSGAVEFIDANGFKCIDLNLHDALMFSPGTIHRLINPNSDLEILVFMQNSGLPEHGDNVVCFSDEWLKDDATYDAAMKVTSLEDAYQRRDRGVTGFLQLKAAFEQDGTAGQAALSHFYAQAIARTARHRADWARIVQNGAMAEAQESLDRLQALQTGDAAYLTEAEHHKITGNAPIPGFCGHLVRYFDPAALAPEGIRHT